VIHAQPGDVSSLLNRGLAYLYLKKYKEASDDYTSVIQNDPADQEAYTNRGVARQYLNDLAGACEDWKKASELGSVKSKTYLQKYCSQ
jgi:tetratricopeptide (TPR) repeat protein